MALDPLGIQAGFNFGSKALDVVSEWIEDPDKKLQVMFELTRLEHAFQVELLKQTTNPWVDGSVKFLYALRELARPLGAIAMNIFGGYLIYRGVIETDQINDTAAVVGGAMQLALPAWGTSRHLHKAQQEKEETKRVQYQTVAQVGKVDTPPRMFEH